MIKQFSAYFVVAAVGYVVDLLTLILLKEVFGAHYLVAAACGFILGLTIVYLLSAKYVFGASKLQSKSAEFGLFALIGIVGLFILGILMWLMTEFIGIDYLMSKILATAGVYMWNFFARRSLYHN